MINDSTQRIPPQGDNRENEVGGLLVKLKKLKTKVPMTTGFRKFFFEKVWWSRKIVLPLCLGKTRS